MMNSMIVNRMFRGILNSNQFKRILLTAATSRRKLFRLTTRLSSKDATQPDAPRYLPKTLEQFQDLATTKCAIPENPKSVLVSFLGLPNSGKSSVVNQLMQCRICSVSTKRFTTRNATRGILVRDHTQMVLIDTPGLIEASERRRFNLEESVALDPIESLYEADIIAVVVNLHEPKMRLALDAKIKDLLKKHCEKPSILILNQIDRMKAISLKRATLNAIKYLTSGTVGGENLGKLETAFTNIEVHQAWESVLKRTRRTPGANGPPTITNSTDTGWSGFDRVFVVSGLDGEGIGDLKNYLLRSAKPREWLFKNSNITDLNPHDIVQQIIRENVLNFTPEGLGEGLSMDIKKWHLDEQGDLHITVHIDKTRKSLMSHLSIMDAKIMNKIAEKSRHTLKEAFGCEIYLQLSWTVQ